MIVCSKIDYFNFFSKSERTAKYKHLANMSTYYLFLFEAIKSRFQNLGMLKKATSKSHVLYF